MMHKKNTGNLTKQVLGTLIILGLFFGDSAQAQENCEPLDKKRIKIEGYISKNSANNEKLFLKNLPHWETLELLSEFIPWEKHLR